MKTTGAIPRPYAKKAGGRPRKYDGPSRPITVTLPEATLAGLSRIDPDRGKAIVKLTDAAVAARGSETALVQIVEMASNTGLIVISSSLALRRIPFLHLVEVAPGRCLIALDPGNDFKNLELAVRDVLDDLGESEGRERALLTQLIEHIRRLRKSDRMSMAEILFVKLDRKTGR